MLAVLVLDALNQPLLERLIDGGRLPTIARLREDGTHLPLEGSAAYLEGSVHTTLHTGLEAPGHGVFSPFQWSAPDQRCRLRDAFEIPPAVWKRLSDAGRRSLLIDPYDCLPPRDLNGTAICGWQFTNRVALPAWSSDSSRRVLSRHLGRPRSGDEIFGRPDPADLLRLRTALLDAPRRLAGAVEALLERQQPDLLWIDMAAMHLAGHQFFDVDAVARTEGMDSGELALLRSAMEEIYVEGDAAIARILERLPSGSDLILTGPSTMVAERDRSDMLPGMVSAVLDGPPDAGSKGRGVELWRIRSSLPPSLRSRAARLIPDRIALGIAARMLTPAGDWSSTRAFAIPNDPGGGVRLNLRGRERLGIVDPGEAEELIAELISGLESFRDPDGARSVEVVGPVSELEPPGPRSWMLPDLVVRWRPIPSAGVTSVQSESFGTITRRGIGSGRSGNHTGGAWAILVPGRSRLRDRVRPARLVDIAATACSLLGASTEGLAGEPLMEAAIGAHRSPDAAR